MDIVKKVRNYQKQAHIERILQNNFNTIAIADKLKTFSDKEKACLISLLPNICSAKILNCFTIEEQYLVLTHLPFDKVKNIMNIQMVEEKFF
ncbi:hypothetical protein Q4571_16920 [Bacillus thuringiensis]|nr:hypothetical protein [Bacillus thuringiensis]